MNLIQSLHGVAVSDVPPWFESWEATGLIGFEDKDGDGRITMAGDPERNELRVDRDIMVLANPEWLAPGMSEGRELALARGTAAVAVVIAAWFGIHPPGFVAQVVAFAFGLAASSFFPALVLGIFWKRATREGAVAGMISGISFTASYIVWFKYVAPGSAPEGYWLGISPEGIGAVGMLLNFAVAILLSLVTKPPPAAVQELVDEIRLPRRREA